MDGLDDQNTDFLDFLLATNNGEPLVTTTSSAKDDVAKTVDDELCGQLCEAFVKAMPYFGVAYERLRAIKSLKDEKELIDHLCYLFIKEQEKIKGTICPDDGDGEVDEFYIEAEGIKAKLLAKCSGDDAVEFKRIVLETREKHAEHVLKNSGSALPL